MKNSNKGDEKFMGPMFPRLHVNDTEKGGPRAPPRNKMALYEQLSIPSQRFRTNKESIPPASTSQAHSSRHSAEKPLKPYPRQDAPVSQFEPQNKIDEDEFTVPIFLHSRNDQIAFKCCHSPRKLARSTQIHSNYSSTLQDSVDENLKQNDVMQVRNNTGRQNKGTSKDTIASDAEDSLEYSLYSKEAGLPFPQQNTYEQRHGSPKNLSGIKKVNYRFLAEQQPDMQPDSVSSHLKKLQTLEVNRMSSSVPLRESPPEDLLDHDGEFCEETASPSIPMIREDGGNEASETSAVEYISATDMSPDDVVGIIGLKHFWKARTAIVKQQKAFAVQVFELHRLMKVQKLIAESPHLLLEGIAHIAKSVVSSVKKLPLEYIVEAPSNILNHRNDFEKIPRKRERSAENAEKASLHPPEYKQFPPNAGEPHIDSWSSYPSQAHQWLIPVMSPTEGLVYKPYSGHGFPTPLHGGPENFHPSGYGLLASHQQFPGMGVPSAGNHGFFPSYSMPVVNAVGNNHAMDHTNHFALQGLQHLLSGGGAANFNVQRQESFHLPIQNSGANHGVLKSKKPTASEVQSTGLDNIIELSNPLAPLCSSPVTDISSCRSNGDKGDQQARVIRVVPHNRKSATESVARIFHSIQEERKQFDFV